MVLTAEMEVCIWENIYVNHALSASLNWPEAAWRLDGDAAEDARGVGGLPGGLPETFVAFLAGDMDVRVDGRDISLLVMSWRSRGGDVSLLSAG